MGRLAGYAGEVGWKGTFILVKEGGTDGSTPTLE